jgi:heptaprenyl diphosphate synthase
LLLANYQDEDSKALLALIQSELTLEQLPEVLKKLRQHPVMTEARLATEAWAERAIEAIAPLPDGSVKSALEAFAKAVVDRQG